MVSNLPKNVIEKSSEEIRSILTKRDMSDVMWGLANLLSNCMKTLGYIPPGISTATEMVNYVKENFGNTAAQRNQVEFILLLFERLKQLEGKLEQSVIYNERFEIYLQRFLDQIKYEQYNGKAKAFRNALVNIATSQVSNDFEIEYFITSLLSFSNLHFAILSYLYNPLSAFSERGINLEQYKMQSGGEIEIIKQLFSNVDIVFVELVFTELFEKGFTIEAKPFGGGLTSRSSYVSVTRDILTPLGKRLISFFLDNN